jgi:hypothetical protein
MSSSRYLIIAILLCLLVLATGCTGCTGTAVPAPTTSERITLESLVLTPSELPQNLTLRESRVKNSTEVSKLARDLGWEAGYEVIYTYSAEGAEPTVLVHSLAVYPANNVLGIAALVDRQDRPAGFLYENISDPDQRFYISGFSAKVSSTETSAVSPGSFVIAGGKNVSAAASGTTGDFAEFIVFRGKVFEVLKMTGPQENTTLLHDLARKAAEKIP